MAPPGHNSDAASKAAHRCEPIILRGFDRHRQLDIQFQAISFGTSWLRRTYTNENHNHITLRTRNDEVRLHEVRYGNNIAVLLKACYQLRQFHNSPNFWPAIAQGFGASADATKHMVKIIVDARKIYHRNNPDEEAIDRSGANIAADRWLDFLANTRGDSGAKWSNDSLQIASLELRGYAGYFFRQSEGKQVDLANVLPKKVDFLHYSPPDSRKRFASPEPLGRPPSPKRRPSYDHFNRTEPRPARLSQSLTPLETGSQNEGPVGQEYQTPISTSDRPSWPKSPTQGSPKDATEVFPKIRSTASQNRNGLPVNDSHDSTPKHALSNGSSDMENLKLRERVATLEKELFDMKSRLSDDQHHRNLVKQILSDHGLLASNGLPSTPDPAVKILQARVTYLEGDIVEKAVRHAHDIEDVKESIQSAKNHMALLKEDLVKKRVSAPIHDPDVNPTSNALENVQPRLTCLENKTLIQGAEGLQTELASRESKATTTQSQPREPSVPVLQQVTSRSRRLESQVMPKDAKEHSQVDPTGTLDMISKLEAQVDEIGNRVSKMETRPDEGEYVRELESRVAVMEHRQDREKGKYATKDLMETTVEQLESRLAREKIAAADQLQNIHQRLMAIEIQSSRLLKANDVAKAAKSPSPPQEVQRNVDEMFKTINSLPSTKLLSDMIDEHDQILKTDIEKLRRNLDSISTTINSLPNVSHVSERIFRLEKSLRAELDIHHKSTIGLVDRSQKDIQTLQIQVKGLNKLWNEATTGIAKSDTLLALKLEVDALKVNVATQTRRFDEYSRGLNKAQGDTVKNLECHVADLSTQVYNALSEVTPDCLLKRMQEVRSNIEERSATRDARLDALEKEIETLHARDSILARALNDVGQLKRRA